MPNGDFFVSDGYNGTRVAKFDKDGKFLLDFGKAGDPGKETRPGYMNNVHGVAVDVTTNRVFVNDRDNNRVQIFDVTRQPTSPSGGSRRARRACTSCRSARTGLWRPSIA